MPQLAVSLHEDFILDAGTWQEINAADGSGPAREIAPPEITLHEQIHRYLTKRLQGHSRFKPTPEQEAMAAVAVCLRWGTYLCVLANETLPEPRSNLEPQTSLISDEEMARINIEASAALENWIALKRRSPLVYNLFVEAALRLPLPFAAEPKPAWDNFFILREVCSPETSEGIKATLKTGGHLNVEQRMAELEGHPDRVLANSLIQYCWRNNNPVENLHAGFERGYPLATRRLTSRELRLILLAAARNLTTAFMALNDRLMSADDPRPWSERVLPFHFHLFLKCPNWSLTEKSRRVILHGPEPALESKRGRIRTSKI